MNTVLVIEDNASSRQDLCTLLESGGFQVISAENGKSGLEKVEQYHPDIVITDIFMPVMDGTAFLERLRADPHRTEIPVIICTGKELNTGERQRLLGQAQEILGKGEGFKERLMTVLSRYFPEEEAIPSAAPPEGLREDGEA